MTRRYAVIASSVTAVVVFVLCVAIALLSRENLISYGPVGPARPCEPAFAESLGRDPIFTAAPGNISAPDSVYSDCEDSDGGGVSYAEKEYDTTMSPANIIENYERSAKRLGWQIITTADQPGPGPQLCAHRTTSDGHSIFLDVRMDLIQPSRLADGTHTYIVSIEGDPGDPPC